MRSNDQFWASFALEALEAEYFLSLASLAQSSDLVVVGKVDHLSWGRQLLPGQADGFTYVNLHMIVSKYLGGRSSATNMVVELMPPAGASLEALTTTLPEADQLMFLRNKGEEARSLGLPERFAASEDGFFRLANVEQGHFANIEGRVFSPQSAAAKWVRDFAGVSFDDLANTITLLRVDQ